MFYFVSFDNGCIEFFVVPGVNNSTEALAELHNVNEQAGMFFVELTEKEYDELYFEEMGELGK